MVPVAVGPGMSHSHGTPAMAVASTGALRLACVLVSFAAVRLRRWSP